MLSIMQNVVLQQDQTILISSLLLSSVAAIIIIIFASSSSYFKCVFKKFIRIQIRKRLMNPKLLASDKDSFVSYYRSFLCNIQNANNEELGKILQKNSSSAFFVDHSISFLNSHRPSSSRPRDKEYASIDEFRDKVPLTTYKDYHAYIDRIVIGGEKNLLSSDSISYFNTSSGTTARIKLIPMTTTMTKKIVPFVRVGYSVIWGSFPSSSVPSPEQRPFQSQSGKKPKMFERTKDGIPIGPLTQAVSAIPLNPVIRKLMSVSNVISLDLIEGITDFETSVFVQLVFALTVPDLYSYSVTFTPGFIHTIKIIQNYFEEISLCISSANFDQSSLVRNNIHDIKFRVDLNRALNDIAIEYGGEAYRLERATHIRRECLKKDLHGILHRLWPKLIYASTVTGSTFAMFKEEIQSYCGKKLPLINYIVYAASEGFFGISASIYTDEYFLLPTCAFFEFIKEEDVHKVLLNESLIYESLCLVRFSLV
jgi:hypothetical protein